MKKKLFLLLIALVAVSSGIRAGLNKAAHTNDNAQDKPACVNEKQYKMKNLSHDWKPSDKPYDMIKLDATRSIRLYICESSDDKALDGNKYTLDHRFVINDEATNTENDLYCDRLRYDSRPDQYPIITDAVADKSSESLRYIVYVNSSAVVLYEINLLTCKRSTAQAVKSMLVYNKNNAFHKPSPNDSFCFLTPSIISVSFGDGAHCHFKAYGFEAYTLTANEMNERQALANQLAAEKGSDNYVADNDPIQYKHRLPKVIWSNRRWYDANPLLATNPIMCDEKIVSEREPEYDMNEWDGWSRMNRDSSWLKD
ncbi:MAG: hypothetical protein IK083_07925 [Abditibacteriota bacterium]|nr:hypothetical protein [Abditibacteriota bacterium]